MRIDMEKLRALIALPDAELWAQARKMAAEYGFPLAERVPPHEELERLRNMVREGERIRLTDAAKIINQYRERRGGS